MSFIAAGSRLGPYEVTTKLGEGGMGEVWRARDGRLGREVAIRILPPELAESAEREQRFEREARAASSENLLAVAPGGATAHYYRSSGGAEVGLLLVLPRGERWAVEIKRSTAPAATRGFHEALADLKPHRRFVVYPGVARFPLAGGVEAAPLAMLARELAAMRKRP